MPEKICNTCERPLELDQFYGSRNAPDGHINTCKDCKTLIPRRLIAAAKLLALNCNIKFNRQDRCKTCIFDIPGQDCRISGIQKESIPEHWKLDNL